MPHLTRNSPSPASSARTLSVRVEQNVQNDLALLARVSGSSIAQHVRTAVDIYVFNRRNSDSLQDEIAAAKRRFSGALSALEHDEAHRSEAEAQAPTAGGVPLTARLSEIQESRLKGLALLDDTSIADQVRRAVEEYLVESRHERSFVAAQEDLDRFERRFPESVPPSDGQTHEEVADHVVYPIYTTGVSSYALDGD